MPHHLIYLVVYTALAMLHFVGLILLSKADNDIPNQTILTKNLAVAEMLFCINYVVLFSVLLNVEDPSILKYIFATDTLFYTEIRFTMVHMILDRFLEIHMNIKYPVYMSLKKVLLIVVIHWSISAVCGIINFILAVLYNAGLSGQFTLMLNLGLDIAILISFITTYVYFYITVRRLRSFEVTAAGQPPESRLTLLIKKFKLPCYIVATYICFNLTSTIMFTTAHYVPGPKQANTLNTFGHVPAIVGIMSDALIYVFANRNVRKLIRSFCNTRNLCFRKSDTAA